MPPNAHLAQVNVGRLRAPVDAPEVHEFVANLDRVNALAEASPGFVWRLKDDSGNATSIPFDPDPLVIVNLTVWASIEALEDFVLRTAHVEFLRRRREWFDRMEDAYLALWWVVPGTEPTLDDARARLDHLRRLGPTPTAFTFRRRFEPEALAR